MQESKTVSPALLTAEHVLAVVTVDAEAVKTARAAPPTVVFAQSVATASAKPQSSNRV